MRTWMVIYKRKGEVESAIVMAKTFDDAVYEIWHKYSNCDIKGIFEVAR